MISTKHAEKRYDTYEPLIHQHVVEIGKIVQNLGENLEGNSFFHGNTFMTSWFFVYKRINFLNIVLDNNVKKMAEIGFNAGHSAVVFLAALPITGSITFFDLNDHRYAFPCFSYLKRQYPQVGDFIPGDSRKTLPEFVHKHQDEIETFDCIHVDGGHSDDIIQSDIFYADMLLKKGGIMILDDTQLKCIEDIIPALLSKGYTFAYQIPTFGFSHVCMVKSSD